MGRRNEHTRDEIRAMALAAARTRVRADGLAALSARKVATDIGYTVGSLYNIFHNLDDLVMHLNAQSLEKLTGVAAQSVDETRPGDANLRALAVAYVDFAFDNRLEWAAIFEHTPGSTGWPAWYKDISAQPLALIAREISRISPSLTPTGIDQATRLLFCAVHGACLLAIHERLELNSRETVLEHANLAIETWLKANRI